MFNPSALSPTSFSTFSTYTNEIMKSPPNSTPTKSKFRSSTINSNNNHTNSMMESIDYAINYPIHKLDAQLEVSQDQVQLMPDLDSINMKKYATSVDERNFLTVYEYMVNNQWVIWDYYTGYVHLTGLWKAIGNSKADIVKLIDNSPDLEPVIRRVRGGFLKIQGTWLPYNVAKTLASRTCFFIRFALIPIFGSDFPDLCLRPHEAGFGQLQLNLTDPSKKRKKKRTNSSGINNPVNNTTNASPTKRRKSDVPVVRRNTFPQSVEHEAHTLLADKFNLGRNQSALSSSSDDEFDEEYEEYDIRLRPRAATFSGTVAAPPLPMKLALADENLIESPDEFVEVLQATRSLQQISVGSRNRRVSFTFDHQTLGGGFECGGKLWSWDGKQQLNIIGYKEDHKPVREVTSTAINYRPIASMSSIPRILPSKDVISPAIRTPSGSARNIMDINGLLT